MKIRIHLKGEEGTLKRRPTERDVLDAPILKDGFFIVREEKRTAFLNADEVASIIIMEKMDD